MTDEEKPRMLSIPPTPVVVQPRMATTPPGAPPQFAEPHAALTGPGPLGAAVDPPPCSPETPAIAATTTTVQPREDYQYPGLPDWMSAEALNKRFDLVPDRFKYGPYPEGLFKTVEPALLGKETAPARLAELMARRDK